jgi:hypothetical protein
MAETTDRPRETTESPSGGAELGSMPPLASETYRPLSLQALAGFGVAIVYALIVTFGAAVALVNHIPWLLPTWSFLIPILAVVLCWIARTRIRNSEGTLSGLPFTTWGLRLSIIVGLTYAAYYGSTYFAVRQQAIECADEFFRRIKDGRPDLAFMLSIAPASQRVSDEELRAMLEATYNNPMGRGMYRPGPFTMFCEQDFVRLIQLGGADTRLTPLGMLGWDYEKGSYVAVLKYQAVNPYADFQITIALVCPDSKPGDRGGPQWRILLSKGETQMDMNSATLTPEGQQLLRQAVVAQGLAKSWVFHVNQMQWDEAYRETLPPARRESLRGAEQTAHLLPAAPAAGLSALGLYDDACREYLAGRQKFLDGDLLQIDDKKFWASSQQKAAILKRVHNTFRPREGGFQPVNLQLQEIKVPLARTSDGERLYLFDILLVYPDEQTSAPKYIVMGQLAVAMDEREAHGATPSGRIKGIELGDSSSGRTAPAMQMPGQAQGG